MKKNPVLHPYLFAVYPILFLYAYNMKEARLSHVFLPLFVILSVTVLMVFVLKAFFKNLAKAGLLVTLLLLFIFGGERILALIQNWHIGGFAVGRIRYLALPFVLAGFWIIRTKRDWRSVTVFLNAAAFSMIILSLANIGIYNFKIRSPLKSPVDKSTYSEGSGAIHSGGPGSQPDIYYIVLDEYASSYALKNIFDYDNHEFYDYLSQKGFYIASHSITNYPISFLVFASALNFEYLNYLSDSLGKKKSNDWSVPLSMIEDNKAMRFLKSKGYKFFTFNSGLVGTDKNRFADVVFECGVWDEFTTTFFQTTILKHVYNRFLAADRRKRILFIFSKLGELSKIEKPKFVFAHIVAPHAPYVFGAQGEDVSGAKLVYEGDINKEKQAYLNQLIFVSQKTESLVDEILSNSKTPPIIIIQSDHGSASTFQFTSEEDFTPNPDEKMLKERMRNFSAFYLPAGGSKLLYDSISPVNNFRLIFNYYFGTDFKLLEDKAYYCTYTFPYKYRDVTDIAKYE